MLDSSQPLDLFPEQFEIVSRIYATLSHQASSASKITGDTQKSEFTSSAAAFSIPSSDFLQSYLIVGARHFLTEKLVKTLAQGILCSDPQKNCGICRNCKLIEINQHPDYVYITNVDSNTIKIDSIRELQLKIHNSLSIARYKLVVINPADKLNIQAASALLKILEEPPDNTIFMLFSENIKALPVTIVSRCHKYYMRDYNLYANNYCDIGRYYPEDDERYTLIADLDKFIIKLTDLHLNKTNVCEIAGDFNKFKLENVLWFLYLVTAQLIKLSINNYSSVSDNNLLNDFANSLTLSALYKQLDKIQIYLRAILNNVTLNNSLCVENILLGYKLC